MTASTIETPQTTTTHSRPTLRQRITRLFVISITTILVTLGGAEFVVRAVPLYPDLFYQYDPVLGWQHYPNMSGTYIYMTCLGEYSQTVHINGQGLHDIERTYERADGTYRVLLLGDSLAAGFEVPLEDTFFRVAVSILNNDRTQIDIINGGHQGYQTAQELVFYQREGLRYSPDMVIVVIEPANDLIDNNSVIRYGDSTYFPYFEQGEDGALIFHEGDPTQPNPERDQVNGVHDFFYDNSRLYRLLYDRRRFLQNVAQLNTRSDERTLIADSLEISTALIRQLRDSVAVNGAQFGVILAPLNWDRPSANTGSWEWLETFLTAENIPYVNPQARFDELIENGAQLFYACDKYHWTRVGHAVMADILANFIRDLRANTAP